MIVKGLLLVSLLVILKNQWSNIIGKFCLKEWLIALYLVRNFVSASIQEVRTLNLSVYIIHYIVGIILADFSEVIVLQAFALIQQTLKAWWFKASPEKIKNPYPFQYLGHQLYPKQILVQNIHIRKDNLLTLHALKSC